MSRMHIDHPVDSDEYRHIEGLVKDLLELRPGRKLIRRLLQTNESISIQASDLEKTSHTSGLVTFWDNKLTIKVALTSNGYFVVNANGEKKLQKINHVVVFAHELIHVLHQLENPSLHQQNLETEDDACTNREEKHTITGVVIDEEGNDVFDPLCENVIQRTLELDVWMDHKGVILSGGLNPLLALESGATYDLKRVIDNNPGLVNELYEYQGKKISLLTAALLMKQYDAVEILLERGASVDLEDGWGGPLHAAIETQHLPSVERLVALGARPVPGYGVLEKLLNASLTPNNYPNIQTKLIPLLKAVPWRETIDERIDQGNTPLMQCIHERHPPQVIQVIEILLQLGADPSLKSRGGATLLYRFLDYLYLMQSFNPYFDESPYFSKFLEVFEVLVNANGMDLRYRENGETAAILARRLYWQDFNNILSDKW